MNNQELLNRLDAAFKDITDVTALGDSILATQQFDRFVEAMQDRTSILPNARFIPMDAHQTNIDRVGFVGRVLTKGIDKDDDQKGTSESFVKPDTWTNKLNAVELRGKVALEDRALRRNIEKGNFESHLVDLFGQAAGRDFEEWALLADTDYSGSNDILLLSDGWKKLSDNKVYGQNGDFDPEDAEEILAALLDALPKQYLANRNEWRYYVPYEVEDGYRNKLKARGTALGDTAQTTGGRLMYKGIPVEYSPMLERSKTIANDGAGRVAMLQHPDNMAWGVFHEVTIEPKRDAENRRTEFYLTIECDADYEDEKASAVALLDQTE